MMPLHLTASPCFAVSERASALAALLPAPPGAPGSRRGRTHHGRSAEASFASARAGAWGGLGVDEARTLLAAAPAALMPLPSAAVANMLRGLACALRTNVAMAAKMVRAVHTARSTCGRVKSV